MQFRHLKDLIYRNPHPKGEQSSDIFYVPAPHLGSSYVRELENRLAQLERLIREVCCDAIRLV
jgi:hypothetical protein